MKTLQILLIFILFSFSLNASKILQIDFRNDTHDDVVVKSIHLPHSVLLNPDALRKNNIKYLECRTFYVEHPEEDFVDTAYATLQESDYDYITFGINDKEISWYWKATFCSQAVSTMKGFTCGSPPHSSLEFGNVGRGGGATFMVNNQKYMPYYMHFICLKKLKK